MRFCLAFLLAPLAAIAGTWWWLGAPVAMPPSPLAEGARLYCVSYAPFRGAQSPLDGGTHIPAQQIEEDLRNLAKLTDCVRTYSIEHGLDQVPAIAARYGLQVMQGLWLSSDRIRNEQQIAAVIDLVNKHKNVVRSLVVGNEVLLRGEMSGQDLAAVMRRVKAAVQVPVTYADVWEFWLRHPELRDAADFVTVHILPYWEDFPIPAEQAAAHVDSIRAKVVEAFPDKQVLIGETGWPSAGRMREGALPSPVNEALVMHEILAAAARGGYRVNLIEAFDQPWKRRLEGTAGGYWGLFDENRVVKFAWGQPVSDHPHWKLQAAGGLALAAIVFASAWWAAGTASRRRNDAMLWGMVAVMAAVSGIFVGWTVEKAAYESLGAGGWVRSAALLFVGV
ncbi:MAG: beta-(1-6) glucans synthase, partial [Rhizobiales bacterium]|nr:beta-(1-6) glucans synthase [Hyphomicrobiales bacterium]